MENAFSRYENYLHARKEGIELNASFQREQRYLSEQAELLKAEEQRRRMGEMRAYLERQMTDKEKTKAVAKLESRAELAAREAVHYASLAARSNADVQALQADGHEAAAQVVVLTTAGPSYTPRRWPLIYSSPLPPHTHHPRPLIHSPPLASRILIL